MTFINMRHRRHADVSKVFVSCHVSQTCNARQQPHGGTVALAYICLLSPPIGHCLVVSTSVLDRGPRLPPVFMVHYRHLLCWSPPACVPET